MARRLDPVPVAPEMPGVSKRASQLSVGDRWIDCDKVIFVAGKPEKFPGWTRKTTSAADAAVRGLLFWTMQTLLSFYLLGTYRKLYVVDYGETPVDVTPVDQTGSLTNPFTTAAGSATVTVHDVSHTRNSGDEVRFSGASATGGITVSGAYQVSTRLDADNYTIEHSAAATSAVTGGGAVDYVYELPIGPDDPLEGDGYGAGLYGMGNYGEPSDDASPVIIFEPRVWSLAKNGDLAYANPVGLGIYVFDPAATPGYQRAAALTNAPASCRSIFVTPERFLFGLGCDNDPMKVKWPDQDDHTNWTPGSASTANSRRLNEGTRLIGGRPLSNGLSGVWSDTAFYRFQYTGNQFIYSSQVMGTGCGLVSPMAVYVHLGVAYWMSLNGFFMSGGGVPQPIQNADDVREFVLRGLRKNGYEYKICTLFSVRYNFLMWCYVPTGSTDPGLYAAVSLDNFAWVVGTLERSSATVGPDQRPVAAGSDGYLYQHEDGLDADGAIMRSFIARAPLRLASGAMLGEITGLQTDMERQIGTMAAEVTAYDQLNDSLIDRERVTFDPGEDLIDFSIGGRIALLTFYSETLGGDFRMGAPVLEVLSTGKQR